MTYIKNKKVAVIYGGASKEREISLMTNQAVCQSLTELNISFLAIEGGSDLYEQLQNYKPDIAFLAGHGQYAEDGTLQGLLEFLKIPYTGSGVLASSICMNKIFFKQLMIKHQIPTATFIAIDTNKINLDQLQKPPFLPCVVKPNQSGSSIGVSICYQDSDWKNAIQYASTIDHHVMVEQYIKGVELGVPWLNGEVLPAVEIHPCDNHFFDFKRKYQKGETKFICPSTLDQTVISAIQKITQTICSLCNIHCYGRADFIVNPSNEVYILEFNTLPGLTPVSQLTRSAKQTEMSYTDLILNILTHHKLHTT